MAAASKNIVLITGGNAGIGFELAGQLIADKAKHVIIGSRSIEKGEAAVKELQARNQPGGIEMVQLDITKRSSIEAAAKKVESDHGRLDALVNNAGIGTDEKLPIEEQMIQSFTTNTIGPYLTAEIFKPLLKQSQITPRIVSVSSGAASIQGRLQMGRTDMMRNIPYCVSKAGLSMVVAFQETDPETEGFKVFSYCPGFTASTIGPQNTLENGAKPTSAGAAPIVGLLNGERDAESGAFVIGPEMGPEHTSLKKPDALQLPW